ARRRGGHRGLGDTAGPGGDVGTASTSRHGRRPRGALRHFPRPRARHRAAGRPERAPLSHGLRDGDPLPARGWHRRGAAPPLALALLAGVHGVTHGRRALVVLPAAWLAGGVIGLTVHGGVSPSWTALSFVVLGGLVAMDARLPLGATTLLAALLGLGHGYLN